MFTLANRPLENLCTPAQRMASVPLGASQDEVFRLAQRHRTNHVLVIEPRSRKILGYVQAVDLYLSKSPKVLKPRKLIDLSSDTSPVSALMVLQSQKESLARVLDDQSQTVGIVDLSNLSRIVWTGAS